MVGENMRNQVVQPLTVYHGAVRKLIWVAVTKKLQRNKSEGQIGKSMLSVFLKTTEVSTLIFWFKYSKSLLVTIYLISP